MFLFNYVNLPFVFTLTVGLAITTCLIVIGSIHLVDPA